MTFALNSGQDDLKNVDNYRSKVSFSFQDVCHQYIDVMNYFFIHGHSILSDRTHTHQKGIEVITNIFLYILLHTKNLDLSTHIANNCTYYFVEYIHQINNKDTDFVFVNLTLKDAIVYIYRKSIFEINDTFRKKFKSSKSENNLFDTLNLFARFYLSICKQFIYSKHFKSLTSEDKTSALYSINNSAFTLINEDWIASKIKDYNDKYDKKSDETSLDLFNFLVQDVNQYTLQFTETENIESFLKYIDTIFTEMINKFIYNYV